jgi:glycosyltransferase involved in cell wall biosynthesis
MPDIEFRMFGYPIDRKTLTKYDLLQPNISVKGPLTDPGRLLPEEYGALLFTSDYEGLPNLLIEVASLGIPIVASEVGGIRELVAPGCGWTVAPETDVAGYVEALRQALDPVIGVQAASEVQSRISGRFSWSAFAHSVEDSGLLG